jgi:hypothetical protein
MAFGIHALNISHIIALLRYVHGIAGGSCADHAANHQAAASPDCGAMSSTERSAGRRPQRCADYGASNPAIYRRLIGCSVVNPGKSVLLADSIVVTKLVER